MLVIWKKWRINPGGWRVVLTFLYLLTTVVIPLRHTCQSGRNVGCGHTECTKHQFEHACYAGVQPTPAFKQNGLSETGKPNDLLCPACLYLLISKTFKVCSNTSLYTTQTVVRVHVLSQLTFTRQLEWLCSVPLRAPPIDTL